MLGSLALFSCGGGEQLLGAWGGVFSLQPPYDLGIPCFSWEFLAPLPSQLLHHLPLSEPVGWGGDGGG